MVGRADPVRAGTVDDGVFETDFANVELLAGWVLRQNGRATPLDPVELVDAVSDSLSRLSDAHDGPPPAVAAARSGRIHGSRFPSDRWGRSRPSASACSRRSSPTSWPHR